jgi:hypothetical protein
MSMHPNWAKLSDLLRILHPKRPRIGRHDQSRVRCAEQDLGLHPKVVHLNPRTARFFDGLQQLACISLQVGYPNGQIG